MAPIVILESIFFNWDKLESEVSKSTSLPQVSFSDTLLILNIKLTNPRISIQPQIFIF